MAKKIRNEIAVGITFLTVLVLTIFLIVMLADWSELSTKNQHITVKLPYKAGLKGLTKGSKITLGGVKIGSVTDTAIKKEGTGTNDNDISVFFTMKIPVQYQLRTDCILLPQGNILGGQVELSIEDIGQDGEIIKDGQTVELLLAGNVMDALKCEFNPDDPESFFAQLIKDVSGITSKVHIIISQVGSTLETAQTAINNTNELLTGITGKVHNTIAKVDTTLETAQTAIKNTNERIVDERIDSMVSNLSDVSVNLKLTSEDVRRAPWKLLYKPKNKEYRIQALLDSAGAFAAGAERLDNTAVRLNRLVTVSDNKSQLDLEKIESMISELETSLEQFQKAEKKFWDELK